MTPESVVREVPSQRRPGRCAASARAPRDMLRGVRAERRPAAVDDGRRHPDARVRRRLGGLPHFHDDDGGLAGRLHAHRRPAGRLLRTTSRAASGVHSDSGWRRPHDGRPRQHVAGHRSVDGLGGGRDRVAADARGHSPVVRRPRPRASPAHLQPRHQRWTPPVIARRGHRGSRRLARNADPANARHRDRQRAGVAVHPRKPGGRGRPRPGDDGGRLVAHALAVDARRHLRTRQWHLGQSDHRRGPGVESDWPGRARICLARTSAHQHDPRSRPAAALPAHGHVAHGRVPGLRRDGLPRPTVWLLHRRSELRSSPGRPRAGANAARRRADGWLGNPHRGASRKPAGSLAADSASWR